MDWLYEVQNRIQRKNHILFAKNSEYLADLIELMQEQNHRTLILWAFEFAEATVRKLLKRYPNESRLESAVSISKELAAGKVKMPVAKNAILQAHAVTKDIESLEDIALCHAIGQACGVVHTKEHALGFLVYDLTAIVRHYGVPKCKKIVEDRKQKYIERTYYWREHYKDHPFAWADFLMED